MRLLMDKFRHCLKELIIIMAGYYTLAFLFKLYFTSVTCKA